jgi:hypothetical protein
MRAEEVRHEMVCGGWQAVSLLVLQCSKKALFGCHGDLSLDESSAMENRPVKYTKNLSK